MRINFKAIYNLGMAVLLFQITTGGAAPLWAQQFSPQWQGGFSDGQNVTPQAPGGPQQPPRSQVNPSGDSRFRLSDESTRLVARQCAAEMNWPLAPVPWQLQVRTPPVQVRSDPTQPSREGERSVQPPDSRTRQAPSEGVGSISLQDLSAATPPQEVLTPGVGTPSVQDLRERRDTGGVGRSTATFPQQPFTPGTGTTRSGPASQPGAQQSQDPSQFPGQFSQPPQEQLFLERLSPIELSYGNLRQFGFTAFFSPVSTFAPVDDVPVGPDYVLGPGDDMIINVSGVMDGALARTIDRNGQIFLPRVGPVRVWGLTFSQADRLIREEIARYFQGFNTTVTMGRLRTLRVQVIGEVCQPGSYTVSAISTLVNALFAAGGTTKLGSLRNIKLLRNNHEVGTLDLYDFLLKGDRSKDFRLESGDTIFVPVIGSVAAVEGEVKRPAIYELGGRTRVSDLLMMAGGSTPRGYLNRVQVVRQLPSAERVAIDVNLVKASTDGDRSGDLFLQSGDLLRVYPSDYRVYNVAHVEGAVKYPGDYEVRPNMRISELLPREKLLPEAYVDRIEITRRRPDLSTEIIAVNLRKAWAGDQGQDILLQPLDEISVRTELQPIGTVKLEGEFMRPGKYSFAPGERLSSVIRRAGGFTERAYPKGAVFTRVSLKAVEQEQVNEFVRTEEQKLLAAAGTVVVGVEKEEAAQSREIFDLRREMLRAIATRVITGRMVVRLEDPEKMENTPVDVLLEDGDTLRMPQRPSSVFVIGSVRASTGVQYKEAEGVNYYVGRVGGFSKQADQKEVHIVKADGSAVSGFANLRFVEAGDTIIVPPKEEEKVRLLPTLRDVMTILGQTALTVGAIALLF